LANLSTADRKQFGANTDRLFHGALDECHGKCVLKRPELANIVTSAILRQADEMYHRRPSDVVCLSNQFTLEFESTDMDMESQDRYTPMTKNDNTDQSHDECKRSRNSLTTIDTVVRELRCTALITPIANAMNAEAINARRFGRQNHGRRKINGLRHEIKPTQPNRGIVTARTEGMNVEIKPTITATTRRIAMKNGPIDRERESRLPSKGCVGDASYGFIGLTELTGFWAIVLEHGHQSHQSGRSHHTNFHLDRRL
jgi:hypothetical protein